MHGGIYRCTGIYFFKSALFRTFTPTRKNSFRIGRIHSFHIQIRQDI